MGKPIQKKWFSVKEGSDAGDLTIQVANDGAGGVVNETIIKQVGTGVYDTESGRYKLVEGPAVHVVGDGLATLIHDGRYVRRINQYRVTYFDDGDAGTPDDAVWRDADAAVVGTFEPALTAEGSGVLGGDTGGDTSGGDTSGDTDPDCEIDHTYHNHSGDGDIKADEVEVEVKTKSKTKKK